MYDKKLSIEHLDRHDRLEIVQMYVECDCCCLWSIFWEHISHDLKSFMAALLSAGTVGDLYKLVNQYI